MEEISYSYRFNIGNFECSVIRDTISPMELEFLFAKTPLTQLQRVLDQYNIAPGKVMDVMCLFLRTPGHNILIDTGWGAGPQPDTGKLLENLRLQGIQPGEIDTIILSHGHPDHIGGITDDKNGFVFPNARYFACKKTWDYWMSEPDMTGIDENIAHTMLTMSRKNIMPIKDRLNLIDGEAEIVPGIEFINTPGHSPDHGVVIISSGQQRLIYSSDLFHHPLQIARPDIGTVMDFRPEQAFKFRMKIISQIAADNMTVFACHFPFPGIGHIVTRDDVFVWQPMIKSA